jgi:membrane associated rhomboid family serine protease
MFPISNTEKLRTFPIINILLIGVNTLVFLFEISLRPGPLAQFISTYGMIPATLPFSDLTLILKNPFSLVTIFTGTFLHSGWFHFLTNIWILHIFGDNVEGKLGHGRYLIFYLMCGAAANLLQGAVTSTSTLPVIGASGAVAGVMSAYFLFFPRSRITAFILIFPWFIRVPAVLFLGFWFLSQLFSGFLSFYIPEDAAMGGVAWWAHIGGFIFGLFGAWFFHRPYIKKDGSRDLLQY